MNRETSPQALCTPIDSVYMLMMRAIWRALLSFQWMLKVYHGGARLSALGEQSGVPSPLPSQHEATVDVLLRAELVHWLRERLRGVPYWSAGHLHLGTLALLQRDLSLAFASAVAAENLESGAGDTSRARKARHLKAQCYLAYGDGNRAKSLLEPLSEDSTDSEVLTDLAAAHLLNDDLESAKTTVGRIPPEKRGPLERSLLDYAALVKERRVAGGEDSL